MISNLPQRTLPHRDPFLWVHRLMVRNEDGSEGIVELDVVESLELFKGHFPGNPVFPGVIQVEAAAQACLWIRLGELPEGSPLPDVFFVGIDNFRFRQPVVPPEKLQIFGKWQKTRAGLQLWEVELKNRKDQTVSGGTFWLKMSQRN